MRFGGGGGLSTGLIAAIFEQELGGEGRTYVSRARITDPERECST
jgi:hypothetical protein